MRPIGPDQTSWCTAAVGKPLSRAHGLLSGAEEPGISETFRRAAESWGRVQRVRRGMGSGRG